MSSAAHRSDRVLEAQQRLAVDTLTPAQREAGEEIMALILEHNPAPSEEELAAVRREWAEG